jgi:5'-methylthioadenosine nucleosidase
VTYVADMFSTPAIFVKAVIDIVDGEKSTAEDGGSLCKTWLL